MSIRNNTLNDANKELLPATYLVVLAIIANGAKYGYQINKIIEERGYHQWVDIKISSVYKSLKLLEIKGLIKGKKSQESLQPSKKIYTLTSEGSESFKYNVITYLTNPPIPKSMFILALSAIRFLSKDKALTALKNYEKNLEKKIAFLQSNLEVLENIDEFRKTDANRHIGQLKVSEFNNNESDILVIHALFELPIKKAIAEKQWLESFIDKIKRSDIFQEE